MEILDIGCGDKKYLNSIGIDLSYDEADIKLDLDENKIPFKDNHFDLVISDNSIEHFGNPRHIFQEVYRVLKPGGVFRIKTVNVCVWWIRFCFIDWNKGWRHKIGTKRTGHLIHWTPDMLKMWFELHNFEVKKVKANHLFRFMMTIEARKTVKNKRGMKENANIQNI